MTEFEIKRNELLANKVIEGLKSRNMEGFFVNTKEEALDEIDHQTKEEGFTEPADEMTLGYKETKNLGAESTTDKVVYKSSDESVATVDENGNVTAVGKGTCTITSTVEGTDISKDTKVTVSYTFWDMVKYFFKKLFNSIFGPSDGGYC